MPYELWALNTYAGEAVLRSGDQWYFLSMDSEWHPIELGNESEALRSVLWSTATSESRTFPSMDEAIETIRLECLPHVEELYHRWKTFPNIRAPKLLQFNIPAVPELMHGKILVNIVAATTECVSHHPVRERYPNLDQKIIERIVTSRDLCNPYQVTRVDFKFVVNKVTHDVIDEARESVTFYAPVYRFLRGFGHTGRHTIVGKIADLFDSKFSRLSAVDVESTLGDEDIGKILDLNLIDSNIIVLKRAGYTDTEIGGFMGFSPDDIQERQARAAREMRWEFDFGGPATNLT